MILYVAAATFSSRSSPCSLPCVSLSGVKRNAIERSIVARSHSSSQSGETCRIVCTRVASIGTVRDLVHPTSSHRPSSSPFALLPCRPSDPS
jgi:hypothetical protein